MASRVASGRLDVAALEPGEWIVEPDLIYATALARARNQTKVWGLAGLKSQAGTAWMELTFQPQLHRSVECNELMESVMKMKLVAVAAPAICE